MKERSSLIIATGILLATAVLTTILVLVTGQHTETADRGEYTVYYINKILAFEGLALLSLSYLAPRFRKVTAGGKPDYFLPRFLGLGGALSVLIHVIISLELLNPFFFPRFFTRGVLNPQGIGSLVSGVAAFVFILMPAYASFRAIKSDLTFPQWKRMQRTGYLGLLAFLAHVAIPDSDMWFHSDGRMPPASLFAFLLALVPLSLFLFRFLKK